MIAWVAKKQHQLGPTKQHGVNKSARASCSSVKLALLAAPNGFLRCPHNQKLRPTKPRVRGHLQQAPHVLGGCGCSDSDGGGNECDGGLSSVLSSSSADLVSRRVSLSTLLLLLPLVDVEASMGDAARATTTHSTSASTSSPSTLPVLVSSARRILTERICCVRLLKRSAV